MKAPLALAALLVFVAVGGARADEVYSYGAVVCQGDEALVRFTTAANEDAPDFATTPGTLGGDLRDLKPADPSRCLLADGRAVVLRHVGMRDWSAHGMCGGDETQVFSLRLGDQKIYSRETWHNKCDEPYSIASIYYDGTRLTECRIKADADNPAVLDCLDASARLSHPLPETADAGTFKLIRNAPGREAFCASLVEPAESSDLTDAPEVFAHWPALASWPNARLHDDGTDTGDEPELAIDMDNDGTIDRALRIAGDTNYFDGQFWVIAPAGTSADERTALTARFAAEPENLDAARAEGLRIFAGDQTAYAEPRYVRLRPFRSGGETFLSGAWAINQQSLPTAIVVRPNAAGGMDEMCAWQAIPSL